jgi:signal-transduction protein with cAMP-binding, CBS, and nucleotidyltransferase domain
MSAREELARALIPVAHVMRVPPVIANPSDPAADVVRRIIAENVGSVIVVSGEEAPSGIVTERDVLEHFSTYGGIRDDLCVKDVMSTPIISIESNRPLRDALKTMRDNKVRRLAVTRKGKLIGQVTERRLLDSLLFISDLD